MLHGRDAQVVATAAGLAYAAYGYGAAGLAGQLAAWAPGWVALGATDLRLPARSFDGEGYYERGGAAGFVAVQGDAVAIVFRGSNLVDDLVDMALDQSGYFAELRPLIQAALDYAAAEGAARVVVAGHSLGGAMVQRTAAVIEDFAVPEGLTWEMTAFGPPGTDIGDETPFSQTVLNLEHSGDPVADSPFLSGLKQHGQFAAITLPNVEDADDLAELARQKEAQESDPSLVTEHDMARYLLSVRAIANSPLHQLTPDGAEVVVLDGADGAARATYMGSTSRAVCCSVSWATTGCSAATGWTGSTVGPAMTRSAPGLGTTCCSVVRATTCSPAVPTPTRRSSSPRRRRSRSAPIKVSATRSLVGRKESTGSRRSSSCGSPTVCSRSRPRTSTRSATMPPMPILRTPSDPTAPLV